VADGVNRATGIAPGYRADPYAITDVTSVVLPIATSTNALRAVGSPALLRTGALNVVAAESGGRVALLNAVRATGSLTEAKGVVFATREANRLGYELIDAPLTYRGNQGIDLPFFNPSTGRYAVFEAKGGFTQRSLSSLATDTNGFGQGSEMFIDSRLRRYLAFGDGRSNAIANDLRSAISTGRLDSFASFYASKSTYQLPLNGGTIRPATVR
jgi:hypothetical protein